MLRCSDWPGLAGADAKGQVMRSVLKSGFVWQFVAGFAMGAVALVTLHPAEAARTPAPQTASR